MLLSDEQARLIEAKVTQAEQQTSAELVVVVAEQSGDYAFLRALCSGLLALAAALLGYELLPGVSPLWCFVGQAPVAALAYWLLGKRPALRLLIPKALGEACVEAEAYRLFAERGVANTKDKSGVLIYVSGAERRVRILADTGINERVAVDEWQNDVVLIVEGMRARDPVLGIGRAVERIGALLSEAFPRRTGDQNELPDQVLRVP